MNGNWGGWNAWNTCSQTCGGGTRSRNKECNNPYPSDGGLVCQGDSQESSDCSTKVCPGKLSML